MGCEVIIQILKIDCAPLRREDIKSTNNCASDGIGVKLAYTRNEYSPGHSTEESGHLGVDRSSRNRKN